MIANKVHSKTKHPNSQHDEAHFHLLARAEEAFNAGDTKEAFELLQNSSLHSSIASSPEHHIRHQLLLGMVLRGTRPTKSSP